MRARSKWTGRDGDMMVAKDDYKDSHHVGMAL